MCQKTVPKRAVSCSPLEDMSLSDMPVRRVAINLVEPIAQASEKVHRYILTLVIIQLVTLKLYLLKSIETEAVAEALINMYSCLEMPAEVLHDLGTQFALNCIEKT